MKSKEEHGNEESDNSESMIAPIMKLYEEHYSMMNDPQLKAEYEKQMMKTFGMETPTKQNFRENLEKISIVPREKTKTS